MSFYFGERVFYIFCCNNLCTLSLHRSYVPLNVAYAVIHKKDFQP